MYFEASVSVMALLRFLRIREAGHPAAREWRQPARGLSLTVLVLSVLLPLQVSGQAPAAVQRMAATEMAAHGRAARFEYVSEEISSRTNGHLWREKVVETEDGPLRRLLAIDGKPLDASQARAEANRIAVLVANPDKLRQSDLDHKDDEAHATQLLTLLPKAFILTPAGEQGGCTRYAFQPNPSFTPSTLEERVVHAMGGTVSVKEPADRLCTLDAKILEPVEFGFGLLGRVEQGGHFSLERIAVNETDWKTERISVHVEGHVLMLKSLTRNREVKRSSIARVPPGLSLAAAGQRTLP